MEEENETKRDTCYGNRKDAHQNIKEDDQKSITDT